MLFRIKRFVNKSVVERQMEILFSGNIDTYSQQLALPQSTAAMCYNVNAHRGRLKECGGYELFELNGGEQIEQITVQSPQGKNFEFCTYYKYRNAQGQMSNSLVFVCNDGSLYELMADGTQSQLTQINGAQISGKVKALCYNLDGVDCLLLSSDQEGLFVYDRSSFYAVSGAPKIRSMCIHYERLFACENNILWFSDDLNPTNWNISGQQAGYIRFADGLGDILKVVSFADYVYLFRQYGITRVTAYAEQAEFSVAPIYECGGQIAADSIAICGDGIFFLSEDGLFVFDGLSVKKVLENISNLICFSNSAQGTFFQGKYMLGCCLRFDVEKDLCDGQNCAILTFDVNDGQTQIIKGVQIAQFILCDGAKGVAALLNSDRGQLFLLNQSGKFCNTPSEKYYCCPQTDLGYANRSKVVKQIDILSKHDFTLMIECDGEWHYFDIRGDENFTSTTINLSGNLFKIAFLSLSANVDVASALVRFTVY